MATTIPALASATGREPLARARGLTVRRERQRLFHQLDFDLPRGRAVWIRGRNGSGKTTLLRVLAGLRKPDEGGVDWSGRRPLYIGHANALKDELSVVESLRFAARLHGHRSDDAALDAALARVKLDARRDQPVRQLSQGLRRRVALARLALAGDVEAWLLDEPHDALDDESSAALDALIGEQLARGGTVALTHHGQVRLGPERLDTLVLGQAPGTP